MDSRFNEYGIFDDNAANYTAEEAIEANFYSEFDALAALAIRYTEDDCHVHIIEEEDEEEDE